MSLQEKNHGCFFATAFLFTTTTVRNILFLSQGGGTLKKAMSYLENYSEEIILNIDSDLYKSSIAFCCSLLIIAI